MPRVAVSQASASASAWADTPVELVVTLLAPANTPATRDTLIAKLNDAADAAPVSSQPFTVVPASVSAVSLALQPATPASLSEPSATNAEGSSGLVIGAVVGCVVGLLAISILVVFKVKRDRQHARQSHAAEAQRLIASANAAGAMTKGVC